MEKLLVMDVGNVTIRDIATGKITATATASATSIATTVNEDVLRAGWGGGVVATISSEKNVELTFSDVFFSMDYLSMTEGSDIEETATGSVLVTFDAEVKTGLTVDIPVTTPVISEVIYINKAGVQSTLTVATNKVTLPTGGTSHAVGDTVTLHYRKTITGQKVSIDSQKFPKYVEVLFHTRAFNPETNAVVKDIYIQFDKVKPSGNSNFDLAVSTPVATEITMTAMNKSASSTEMGRYFTVPRT